MNLATQIHVSRLQPDNTVTLHDINGRVIARIVPEVPSHALLLHNQIVDLQRAVIERNVLRMEVDGLKTKARHMVSLTVASQRTGWSRSTLTRWINRGAIYGKKSGREWQVDLNSITSRPAKSKRRK